MRQTAIVLSRGTTEADRHPFAVRRELNVAVEALVERRDRLATAVDRGETEAPQHTALLIHQHAVAGH